MRIYTTYLLIFSSGFLFSQSTLGVEEAIDLALKNSELYKKAQKEKLYSETNSIIFNKVFLPNIYASSILPSISKSVTRVTTSEGKDIFVTQNQAYYDLSLNIEQREPIFGGVFTFSSFFNRIDLFGNTENQTYFSTPFSLSYTNNAFIFNPLRHEKTINRLKTKEDIANFNTQLEEIAYQTVEKYFELFVLTKNIEEIRKANIDIKEIYDVAKKRFKIGSINKGELLSLELSILDTESTINTLLTNQKISQQVLESFIKESTYLELNTTPKQLILNLDISFDLALKEMMENNQLMIEKERRKLELELELKKYKSKNRFKININASYGLSNTAVSFNESIENLQDQQSYSLSLKYLLYDFGKNKQQIKLMNIKKDLQGNHYDVIIEDMKQQLYRLVNEYNSNIKRMSLLDKKLFIANERYEFLRKRYSLGKATITDLNIAQREHQQIDSDYLTMLKETWLKYYKIRKITMYDFQNKRKISYL
ncbi:hypothetical protein ATO12_17250 [Aquimarina atlantica]|uniref:Transporter n=1 Tax=Aquimarina atlantica TaxID=1317122 RepID=A0A023BV72_9FLAO|nr:TolC family protein [Aquimarina atlantica]EZH73683.1 hypothetical protein ATO12_17250 [Aquimarina atlantica]